ncbi:MAG: hypothetical protein COX65_03575 [Elusimicrobia bacterium CG_4_10_14_0_2_um_filter_56_8]|nr:MAG: hypothetical protein AUJ51_01660 [Elusimicrobia bacterium CG1_02_56_21]PJA15947.1 MAG: hypothetical protein COX65_03575 [Elusimicrobia bacterium CG_4_10_14_0_2_um_filter_56_8]
MSLNYVFTIDGDWDEYFATKLSEEDRKPVKDRLIPLIEGEIAMAASTGGKFIHFVHTSPLVRDFFLQPEFLALWKKAEGAGGEVGVHCHEEELYKAWHYADTERMAPAIKDMAEGLKKAGLTPRSYRGGYMTFSPKVLPLLESHGIFLDYSCDPGRHMVKNGEIVSDWRGAPSNVYRMDYRDHRKTGDSKVFEIPLGVYIEQQSLFSVWQTCRRLKAAGGTIIVSVLAHTYDFTSWKMRLKIKTALMICKMYGSFINSGQALEKIKEMDL